MKQQEAIAFIQAELAKACTIKQISADLSSKLNAPQEVVEKFVKKIAHEAVAVDFLTDDVIHPPSAPPVIDQKTLASALAIGGHSSTADLQSSMNPASQPGINPLATVQPAIYDQGQAGQPSDLAGQPSDFINPPRYDQAAIEMFVRQELRKQQPQNDVILHLCEATGMSWPQAQQIVARIAAQKQKKTTKNQNLVFIALSLIALLAGIALIVAAFNAAASQKLPILNLASMSPQEIQNLYDTSRQLLWSFLLGSALGVGGLVGLVLTVKKKID